MVFPSKVIHPEGNTELSLKKREISALAADTFDGKIRIKWISASASYPTGAVAVFHPVDKMGHLFEPWVNEYPLSYASNNAPKKVNVME